LKLENGQGVAWKGYDEDNQDALGELSLMNQATLKQDISFNYESIELVDCRKLGISTIGSLKQHPRITSFKEFIESWYLSYFTPVAARSLSLTGPQQHLSIHGDNIGNVVQYMKRDHPDKFQSILNDIASKIPGIDKIDTEVMPDGRLLLKFNDKGFNNSFSSQQMSDGTLKVFAYLLLLSDPTPPPFICIEEPENGLYPKLLEILAQQFREHTEKGKNTSQIFITTHQPYFINALTPEEVWILEKGNDGFSTVRRASEDPVVQGLVEEGLPLGGLWYSDYLG
jgi:predicted ATPase